MLADRRVAVADLPRASVPQPTGHIDVSDNVRQPHRVSAWLVEMFRQQLSAVGRRFHVVFYQRARLENVCDRHTKSKEIGFRAGRRTFIFIVIIFVFAPENRTRTF